MPKAIILINTDVGAEEEVMNNLMKLPEVKEVDLVYGIYDLIVFVEAESHEELRQVVVNKIRKIPHVKNTTTMIIVETLSRKE